MSATKCEKDGGYARNSKRCPVEFIGGEMQTGFYPLAGKSGNPPWRVTTMNSDVRKKRSDDPRGGGAQTCAQETELEIIHGNGAADADAGETQEWLESLDSVLQNEGPGKPLLSPRRVERPSRAERSENSRSRPTHHTSTRFRPIRSRRIREVGISNGGSRAWSAGTPWRWSCAPTNVTTASADIFPRTPRRPPCTKSGSTISSAVPELPAAAISFTFRATRHRAFTPGRFLEGRLDEKAARELPPGAGRGGRIVLLSASLADAGFLAVSHRVDGPGPDHGHLPGPFQPLSASTAG